MAESFLTVSDLYKSKTVTEDDVVRLVKAVLDGATDKAPLTEGYVVDLGAAVQASASAASVLGDKDSGLATKWGAARTAIVLARVERA